jgi:tetratricopeptide (TPR) repeat protein
MVESAALASTSGLYAMKGEFELARELIERCVAMCEEFNVLNVYPTFERRDIEMLAGDFVAAEEWLRVAAERVHSLQHWWGIGFEIQGSIAIALCEQERFEEAARMTEVMPSNVSDYAHPHVLWRRGRARALAALGAPDQALPIADEAVALAEQTENLNLRGDTLLDRAHILRTCEREHDAAEDVDAALALYERKGNLVMAERASRLTRASRTPR